MSKSTVSFENDNLIDTRRLRQQWTILTMTSWALGALIAATASTAISKVLAEFTFRFKIGIDTTTQSLIVAIVAYASLGSVIGFTQWLLLRKYALSNKKWILHTGLGYMSIGALALLPRFIDGLVNAVLTGLIVGTLQQVILRKDMRRPTLWILANISSFVIIWMGTQVLDRSADITSVVVRLASTVGTFSAVSIFSLIGGVSSGFVNGLIMGVVLAFSIPTRPSSIATPLN